MMLSVTELIIVILLNMKKLERKKNWLINNLQVLQEHLEEMFHIDYSILSFEVEAVFLLTLQLFICLMENIRL